MKVVYKESVFIFVVLQESLRGIERYYCSALAFELVVENQLDQKHAFPVN